MCVRIASACFLLGSACLRAEPTFEEVCGSVPVLPEYIVRTWHFEEDWLDVPADVILIDRETIAKSLATSVPDLLTAEANLYFSKVSGSESVAMRGFGENSGLRSLILVDGQPLNPGDMGRVNWEQLPLDSIESVEVLRGGHNVLYGDKALAGVISIKTRRLRAPRLEAEGRMGSFGMRQSSLTGGFGGDRWSVQAGAFQNESEGYRENSASQTRSGFVKAGATLDNGDDLDLRLSLGEIELQYPGGISRATFITDPQASGNLGDEGSEVHYFTLTGRLEGERSWGRWEVLSGYDSSDTDWTFGSGSFGRNQQDGFSFKPRARVGDQALTVIFGGDGLFDTLDFAQYLDEARTLSPSEAELSEWRLSPYVHLEKALTDRLTLSGGLRHEWVRYEVDFTAYDRSQLNPVIRTNRGPFPNPNFKNPPDVLKDASFAEVIRANGSASELSLNYRVSPQWSLWVGYDRVYRYPVFDERASYQGMPLAENVSQDLEAEEGESVELGVKYISGAHEFSATAYWLGMKNEIVFDGSVTRPNSLASGLNINLGAVDRRGGDIAYFYDAKRWGASVQLALVDTEMRAGDGRGRQVPLVPHFRSTTQLWWKPVDALHLRVVHRHVGERYPGGDFTNTLRPVAAYDLFDFSAQFDLAPNCRLYLAVENAFDQRYADRVVLGSYYPGDGRSFSAGVQVKF